jgi:hypothetical protein
MRAELLEKRIGIMFTSVILSAAKDLKAPLEMPNPHRVYKAPTAVHGNDRRRAAAFLLLDDLNAISKDAGSADRP